jgi:hypothetical protein
MKGRGEKIGNALDPLGRHAFGHLQENSMAAWWADSDVGGRPYFAFFATISSGPFFAYFAFFAPPVRFKSGTALALPSSEWIGLVPTRVGRKKACFPADFCAFHCFGEV